MKVSISKSKNTTIYYLSKSVRIGNKTTTKTVEKTEPMTKSRKNVVTWSHLSGQKNTLPKEPQKRKRQSRMSS